MTLDKQKLEAALRGVISDDGYTIEQSYETIVSALLFTLAAMDEPQSLGWKWHPIETAPRDIPILGCNSANRCVDIIQLDTPVDWRYASPPNLWMPLPGMPAALVAQVEGE